MGARDIFGGDTSVARYRVRLQVIDKLVGGVPSSESVIKGWLKSRMDVDDRHLQELVQKTLAERFQERQPSADELAEALLESDAAPWINGFKRIPDTGELGYEGRCMQAALKEVANSAYPGTDWDGKTSNDSDIGRPLPKGCRNGLVSGLWERVSSAEVHIGLGVTEPAGVEAATELRHAPPGPRASSAPVARVQPPLLELGVKVDRASLSPSAWGRIWERGEAIAIGA